MKSHFGVMLEFYQQFIPFTIYSYHAWRQASPVCSRFNSTIYRNAW